MKQEFFLTFIPKIKIGKQHQEKNRKQIYAANEKLLLSKCPITEKVFSNLLGWVLYTGKDVYGTNW